ncbi:MAG: hypothetical protein ABF975_01290 [Liquorilactobacillus hordei]|uniref:hypothetical protein n=1 Tax=Liquorilactobacillus hordei TaxID=468911 RepID=UPI0039EAAFAC
MRAIKALEIELPYRYRAYRVGKPIMYDVQNDEYLGEDSSNSIIVNKIETDDYYICGDPAGMLYRVWLSNGDFIEMMDNQAGLIVTWGDSNAQES